MRITGGTARNRKLKTPGTGKKNFIRPTSDRVREAIFSILGSKIEGADILDLFAGTGSLGIEALSRGAASAIFVDQHIKSLDLIKTNLQNCFQHADVQIIRLSLAKESAYTSLQKRFADKKTFDVILLDPPYEKKLAELALTMVDKTGLIKPQGYVLAEENSNVKIPEKIGNLTLINQKTYGETGIWLFQDSC